jgi:hypothetical protein
MATTITAQGKTYATEQDARARIAVLHEENKQFGASDGRVTEIVLINEAIDIFNRDRTDQYGNSIETLRRIFG